MGRYHERLGYYAYTHNSGYARTKERLKGLRTQIRTQQDIENRQLRLSVKLGLTHSLAGMDIGMQKISKDESVPPAAQQNRNERLDSVGRIHRGGKNRGIVTEMDVNLALVSSY